MTAALPFQFEINSGGHRRHLRAGHPDRGWDLDQQTKVKFGCGVGGPNFVGGSGDGGLGRGRALAGRTGSDCIVGHAATALSFG